MQRANRHIVGRLESTETLTERTRNKLIWLSLSWSIGCLVRGRFAYCLAAWLLHLHLLLAAGFKMLGSAPQSTPIRRPTVSAPRSCALGGDASSVVSRVGRGVGKGWSGPALSAHPRYRSAPSSCSAKFQRPSQSEGGSVLAPERPPDKPLRERLRWRIAVLKDALSASDAFSIASSKLQLVPTAGARRPKKVAMSRVSLTLRIKSKPLPEREATSAPSGFVCSDRPHKFTCV